MRFSGEIVVRRLHALTAKGYKPELGIDGCEFVHMRHLGNGPELMLWGDGQLLNANPTAIKNEADRIIIELEDEEGMRRLLSTVPKPTLIQRVLETSIHDAVLNVMAWVIVIIVSFTFWFLMVKFVSFIRGWII